MTRSERTPPGLLEPVDMTNIRGLPKPWLELMTEPKGATAAGRAQAAHDKEAVLKLRQRMAKGYRMPALVISMTGR